MPKREKIVYLLFYLIAVKNSAFPSNYGNKEKYSKRSFLSCQITYSHL